MIVFLVCSNLGLPSVQKPGINVSIKENLGPKPLTQVKLQDG